MSLNTIHLITKLEKEFIELNIIQINCIKWFVIQNEKNPLIKGRIHNTDDELIQSMKTIYNTLKLKELNLLNLNELEFKQAIKRNFQLVT